MHYNIATKKKEERIDFLVLNDRMHLVELKSDLTD